MNRRGLPIWLLRDFPAFLGVMISFWPLMILVITNGFKAMRGKKVPKSAYDDFPALLANAEARLDFALWREAYRRLGWDPHRVKFTLEPSSDNWEENARRFQSYQRASRNLEACARAYVEDLRKRYNIAKRDAANGCCPHRHAPASRATSPALRAMEENQQSLSSSGASRRGRWHALARDGGGSHSCRGPPPNLLNIPAHTTSAHRRLRSHPHAFPQPRASFPQQR